MGWAGHACVHGTGSPLWVCMTFISSRHLLVSTMQTQREEPVPQTQASSLLSGSLILNRVHSFTGWRSVDIKIHRFARLKSSHLTQDSWKDMGMEMVVWHVGSETLSWAVLHPGVTCVVPGAILLLREWKIKTVRVLSFGKGRVRPQQALKLTANWVTLVWEADSSPERF